MQRLLRPKSIALLGGKWVDMMHEQNRKLGFRGSIWHVHPTRPATAEHTFYRSIGELPGVPDAVVVGIPREATVAVMPELVAAGVGGAVCYASGFAETGSDTGREMTERLVASAGELPFLGPNCYGFINYLDGVALWPDHVATRRAERGVALICQSGTIAYTLTANQRSLPMGYVVTVGNQSRIHVEHLMDFVLDDPRVTAVGIYVEGIKDLRAFIAAAEKARAKQIPIALVKAGRSEVAARATVSHTASLTGADDLYDALFRRLGIARCESLAELCETLKLLHCCGALGGNRLGAMGCSGGDMAMLADTAEPLGLDLPEIPAAPAEQLKITLGERVTISNPLDYHTYIWTDETRLRECFGAMLDAGFDATALVIDHSDPETCDISSFVTVLEQFLAMAKARRVAAAVLASLPETLPRAQREQALASGVAPLQGMPEGLRAIAHAAFIGATRGQSAPRLIEAPAGRESTTSLGEAAAKAMLEAAGIAVPRARLVALEDAPAAAREIGFPVVVKACAPGLLHKTEAGGVALNLRNADQVMAAIERMSALGPEVLVEEMVTDGVAEALLGVVVDPQFGPVLVIGSGGILTELLADSAPVLFPVDEAAVTRAIDGLKLAPLIAGFRGQPAGDRAALTQACVRLAALAEREAARLVELDVNPVIVRPAGRGVVAVDALVRFNVAAAG